MTVAVLGISGPVSDSGRLRYDQSAIVRDFMRAMVTALKEEAPVNKDPAAKSRAGLRTSIQGNLVGDATQGYAIEFTANDYVQYVLAGTRPHTIRPTGRALAFQWHTGTYKGTGYAGRGPRGGFLRSTPFGRLPLKYVELGGSLNRAAGRKNVALGTPRFGGREITQPLYNSRGRMIQRGVLGHIQPVNVRANMGKGAEYYGNIVLSSVQHPGTAPNDFVERALLKMTDHIDAMADAFGEEVADRIARTLSADAL